MSFRKSTRRVTSVEYEIAWEDRPDPINPFGNNDEKKEDKGGGVNNPGPKGGVYYDDKTKTASMVKRDTVTHKKGHDKVRTEKVFLEQIAGNWLDKLYEHMGVPPHHYAHTSLVNLEGKSKDKTGDSTYLRSEFIPNYQEDLWQFAYRLHFKEKYKEKVTAKTISRELSYADARTRQVLRAKHEKNKQILADRINELEKEMTLGQRRWAEVKDAPDISEDRRQRVKERLEKIKDKIEQLKKEQKELKNKYDQKEQAHAQEMANLHSLAAKNHLDDKVITFLANSDVMKMKRPSGVFDQEARRVVSNAIMKTPGFLEAFATLSAGREVINDKGVHNGNYGVAIDPKTGKYILVALDFGAAFCGLPEDAHVYSLMGTGTKFYKNHLLEYDKDIIKSEEMAKAFINLSQFEFKSAVADTLIELDQLDQNGLLKVAKRIGIPSVELYHDKIPLTESDIRKKILAYKTERMPQRGVSLRNQGFGLLLEHCLKPDEKGKLVVDHPKLESALKDYPELARFIQSPAFKNYQFVYHEGLSSSQTNTLKNALANSTALNLRWIPAQKAHASTAAVSQTLKGPELAQERNNQGRQRAQTATAQAKKAVSGLARRFTEGAASKVMNVGSLIGSYRKKEKIELDDKPVPPTPSQRTRK